MRPKNLSSNVLGKNLSRILRVKKITKKALAKHLGVHWETVNKWCKGDRAPTLEHVFQIAEFLHINVEELFKQPPEEPFPGFWDLQSLPPLNRYQKIVHLLTQEFQISLALFCSPHFQELEEKLKTEEGIIEVYNELRKKLEKVKEILQKYRHEIE